MRQRLKRYFLFVALSMAVQAYAQSPAPAAGTATTTLPKITFTFDHPDLPVTHYEIDISADGKAHYESRTRGQEKGSSDEGISRDFTLSADTRDRIFDLVKKAGNLNGDFDYAKHKIAFSGTKTITFTDASGSNTARFNWSENENVMKLADLFQGISGTLEEEPVLQRLRRYDPLGLNAELGKMERLADSGWLRELNLISPILKDIADDSRIMGLARKRAQNLLSKATIP